MAKYEVQDRVAANKTVSVRGAKNVKVKKVKKVKVGKKLKAKIMKVIDSKVLHVNGSYTDNYQGHMIGPINRSQFVSQAGLAGHKTVIDPSIPGGGAFPTAWHFTINEFVNAASILFNNKPIPTDSWGKYRLTDKECFPIKNFILDVRDSWSWYTFKNGTQHAINFALVVCVPKRKGTTIEWSPSSMQGYNFEGVLVNNQQAFQFPWWSWFQGLENDVIRGNTLRGYGVAADSVTTTPAPQDPSPYDTFRMPNESKSFNTLWKTEVVRFYLQPGQEVKYKLQGPKGITIDCGKQFQNDLFMNVQKYSRAVMGILYNSPNAIAKFEAGKTTLAMPGRWADVIDRTDAGFGLFIERSDHCSIRVPEQAGFRFPVVDEFSDISEKQQLLDMRVPKQCTNNWFDPAPAATTREVVDLAVMNPQAPVAPN